VLATPRRGVASTSLPLPCAPLGARTQAAGVRGEEHGKALGFAGTEGLDKQGLLEYIC